MIRFKTLGGEPCGADWQAVQNLCDLYHLKLLENKYVVKGMSGYHVLLKMPDNRTVSFGMAYAATLEEWVTAVEHFTQEWLCPDLRG